MSINTTFDTTVAAATATSYVTVAEADAYIATSVAANSWSELDDSQKQNYLMQATADIDSLRFIGTKYYPDAEDGLNYQRLKFPRSTQSSAYIPEAVKTAACVQALYILAHEGKYNSRRQLADQGVVSYSVSGIAETIQPSSYSRVCPEAKTLLLTWISRAVDFK